VESLSVSFGCVQVMKENKSRNCFHQSGKTHEKQSRIGSRPFSRTNLGRFTWFPALGTGLMLSVFWCWAHAHFLVLDARCVGVFSRLAAVTFLPSFHLPHAITFVLVIEQRIYAAPSGNHLWNLFYSRP